MKPRPSSITLGRAVLVFLVAVLASIGGAKAAYSSSSSLTAQTSRDDLRTSLNQLSSDSLLQLPGQSELNS